MPRQHAYPRQAQGLSRRELLQAGVAAGATFAAWPLHRPRSVWAGEAGQPTRGGILRVWGSDPPTLTPISPSTPRRIPP